VTTIFVLVWRHLSKLPVICWPIAVQDVRWIFRCWWTFTQLACLRQGCCLRQLLFSCAITIHAEDMWIVCVVICRKRICVILDLRPVLRCR